MNTVIPVIFQLTRECVRRNETLSTCSVKDQHKHTAPEIEGEEQYYITSASECPSCGNYVQCQTCADVSNTVKHIS